MAQENKIFIFSDIDDTIIQTARKTDFNRDSNVWAYDRENNPLSYIYSGVEKLIKLILNSQDISFIPTTARNIASYQRTIFFRDKRVKSKIKFVILNFGATILIDNIISKEWDREIKDGYKNLKYPLKTLYQEIELAINKYHPIIKIVDNYYINIINKSNRNNQEINQNIRDIITKVTPLNQYYIHNNGSSFAIIPKFLNKKFALEYLIEREKPILTIGAGDNRSDLDFMSQTDFLLIPKNSYNAKILSQ